MTIFDLQFFNKEAYEAAVTNIRLMHGADVSLKDNSINAFNWTNSPQGRNYWDNLHSSLSLYNNTFRNLYSVDKVPKGELNYGGYTLDKITTIKHRGFIFLYGRYDGSNNEVILNPNLITPRYTYNAEYRGESRAIPRFR